MLVIVPTVALAQAAGTPFDTGFTAIHGYLQEQRYRYSVGPKFAAFKLVMSNDILLTEYSCSELV